MEFIKISSKNDIEKELFGNIFHVTPIENLPSIKKDKGLLPNTRLRVKSKFSNSINGFFRLRGCVSFFDYRDYRSNKWKEHEQKCHPMQIFDRTNGIAVLFLSKDLFDDLIPWTNWKEEEAYSQQIVPYIEIGHKGFVSLEHITKIIIFEKINSYR